MGCDSIVLTDLTVEPLYRRTDSISICQGAAYFAGGAFQYFSGFYVDSLSSSLGCDSIISTYLEVKPISYQVYQRRICRGDSLLWNGSLYKDAGIYIDSLISNSGCDSIVEMHLVVDVLPATDSLDWLLDSICIDSNPIVLADTGTYQYLSNDFDGGVFDPSWLGEGVYTIRRVHSFNACSNLSTQVIVVSDCSKAPIIPATHLPFVEVSPNLNDGRFRVDFGLVHSSFYRIILVDRIGHVLKTYEQNNLDNKAIIEAIEINEPGLSSGFYYIQLVTDSEVLVAPLEIIK